MNPSSEMSSYDSSRGLNSELFKQMGGRCLADSIKETKHDLTTIQTLKTRMVNQLMTELGLPLSYIGQTLATSTPVHPEVAQEMIGLIHKQEQADALFSQDFVSNEKLLKLIKNICKGGRANLAHALLAMDGLAGKLSQVPNTECKKYIENLKYGLSGEPGRYDRESNDAVKRVHVLGVRKVYQELDKRRSNDGKLVDGVYLVMRLMLKEAGGIELPEGVENSWSEQDLTDAMGVYKQVVNEECFDRFVGLIKTKINMQNGNGSLASDEEESNPNKKQKTK